MDLQYNTGEDFKLEVRFYDNKNDKYVWFLSTVVPARNEQLEIFRKSVNKDDGPLDPDTSLLTLTPQHSETQIY